MIGAKTWSGVQAKLSAQHAAAYLDCCSSHNVDTRAYSPAVLPAIYFPFDLTEARHMLQRLNARYKLKIPAGYLGRPEEKPPLLPSYAAQRVHAQRKSTH
jgi:hypothetical protein